MNALDTLAKNADRRASQRRRFAPIALMCALACTPAGRVVIGSGVAFAAPGVLKAQAVTECAGVDDPVAGCAAGKGALLFIQKYHVWTEMCMDFWPEENCGSNRFPQKVEGETWWVTKGICTQQQADDNDPLPMVPCNENRAEDGYCRSRLGCEALDDPWKCCAGLDAEKVKTDCNGPGDPWLCCKAAGKGCNGCPFTGSESMPKPADSRKAARAQIRYWVGAAQDRGRENRHNADNPKPEPSGEDLAEE